MSPAAIQNPSHPPRIIAYQKSKFLILNKIFSEEKIRPSDLYSFIDDNQTNIHLPAGVVCFEYVKILEEFKVIKLIDNIYFSLTEKGLRDLDELKAVIEK